MHSWQGYRKNAWLHDEVKPVSGGYKDHFGGWGATLVDALDTLYIMNLEQDFTIAVADLRKVDFTIPRIESLNVFESTIRYLGGLMSAYDLSKGKYPILLEKAVALGEMLYHAFDTPNRLPVTRWHWERYIPLLYHCYNGVNGKQGRLQYHTRSSLTPSARGGGIAFSRIHAPLAIDW